MILSAEKPVLVCGGGVKDATHVQKLARLLEVPVATTYLHNDVYPIDDTYTGLFGVFRQQGSNEVRKR